MSNIKSDIINNVTVTMSVYIQDREALDVLELVLANELMKVNVEEITTLPAEVKSSVDQRNAYLVQLFMIQKRHLKKRTIEAYMGSVRRLVLATGKRLDLIDTLDIDWYLAQYEKHKGVRTEQITNRTYNNERRNLSAFFTWMRKSKIIQDNPVDNVDAKKVVMGKIDYYSREEIIELRDACKTKRDRAIIEVFRSTGARVGEIADIRLGQVDMNTGDILIIGEKGGRARTLYLDAEARYYLAAYLDERKDNSPYLFTQTVGRKAREDGDGNVPNYHEKNRQACEDPVAVCIRTRCVRHWEWISSSTALISALSKRSSDTRHRQSPVCITLSPLQKR